MTDKKIISVDLRHDSQSLVVEVGKPLPAHYQRPGRTVMRIDDKPMPSPLWCVLDDGEVIFIGRTDAQVTYG